MLPVAPMVSIIRRLFQFSAKPQETTADRTARVSEIHIVPGKIVAYQNQRVSFSAVGVDTFGKIAHGAKFSWSSSDESNLQFEDGQALMIGAGLVWVTASTPSVSARVPVLIRPGARPLQSDSEWRLDQDQLKPDGTLKTSTGGVGALIESLMGSLAPTVHAQTGGGDSGDFLYDELWSEPRNLVGSPRNRAMAGSAIGAVLPEGSNFEFSIPIVSLPGTRTASRGLDELQQPQLVEAWERSHVQCRELLALYRILPGLWAHCYLCVGLKHQVRAH